MLVGFQQGPDRNTVRCYLGRWVDVQGRKVPWSLRGRALEEGWPPCPGRAELQRAGRLELKRVA